MKVPNEISTLKELREWVEKNEPTRIEIGSDCQLTRIIEFGKNEKEPRYHKFRGIPIHYEEGDY